MTIQEWVAAANKLLKQDDSLSYKDVEEILAADGHARPPGITQKGSRTSGKRFGRKAKRTAGQNARRKQQESTSTSEADEAMAAKSALRNEDKGIAEYADLQTPHREHLHSQDSAHLISEGAPGDYVENIPQDVASYKTALEQRIRTDYDNKYSVGIGTNNLRVIPKEYFDEIAHPDQLPGIDIDETKDLDSQLKKLAKNGNGNGNGNGLANGIPNGNGGTAATVIDTARQVVSVKPAYSHADVLMKLLKGLA